MARILNNKSYKISKARPTIVKAALQRSLSQGQKMNELGTIIDQLDTIIRILEETQMRFPKIKRRRKRRRKKKRAAFSAAPNTPIFLKHQAD